MTLLERIATRAAVECPITTADRQAAIDAIIDTLACIVAGYRDSVTQRAKQVASDFPSTGRSSLVGGGTSRASDAAMLNGISAHALDFDDNFSPAMSHASAVMVPALIALGQAKEVTGRLLVDAYLAGLEAQALVGQGINPTHYQVGWHATSTIGAIGSALGGAVISELGPEQRVMAMSLAVSAASGVKGQFGSQAKPFHAGIAARNAVESCLYAEAGVTGRTDILERPQGFGELFCGGEPPHWNIPDATVAHIIGVEGLAPKIHPCCGSTHYAIDMIHDLRQAHGFQPQDVEHIALTVGIANYRNLAYRNPQNEMEARFSMQYCIARALYQDVLVLGDFTPQTIMDPRMRNLFERIDMTAMPESEERASSKPAHKAVIQLKDGRRFTAERSWPRGTLRSPLSEEAKKAKFVNCMSDSEGAHAEALYEQLLSLDDLPDITLLGSLVSGARMPVNS